MLSRRGGALSAATAGAALVVGFQIAAPTMAQAESPAANEQQAYQRIVTEARSLLENAAAGETPSAASVAEMLGRSAGSALPAVLGGSQAVVPVSGRVTSEYGARWGTEHGGVDIAGDMGDPILAAADGDVAEAGPAPGFGKWVRLVHDDGTSTVYGHIHEALVAQGQRVGVGQPIATVGNRGDSTGPHLHFETRDAAGGTTDPELWLAQRGAVLGAGGLGLGSTGSGSLDPGSVNPDSVGSGSSGLDSPASESLGARP